MVLYAVVAGASASSTFMPHTGSVAAIGTSLFVGLATTLLGYSCPGTSPFACDWGTILPPSRRMWRVTSGPRIAFGAGSRMARRAAVTDRIFERLGFGPHSLTVSAPITSSPVTGARAQRRFRARAHHTDAPAATNMAVDNPSVAPWAEAGCGDRTTAVQPEPNARSGSDVTVQLDLTGGESVPAVTGPLRGDQGHVHLCVDGKLISMAYGTTQDLHGLAPGPHTMQAEFVATDHAPFKNRVVAAVLFQVEG